MGSDTDSISKAFKHRRQKIVIASDVARRSRSNLAFARDCFGRPPKAETS